MTTALVTGASAGIGEAIARELARRAHDLVLVARSEDRLAALAAELRDAHGVSADVVAADLAAPGAARALVTQLHGRPIDVLVNNAGFGDFGPFAEADADKLSRMLQLNVVALTELTRELLPPMLDRRSGRILNLASTAAFLPGPLMATYYATKAYVLSLGEALAEEVKGSGVTVTTLCPGPVASEFQAAADMGASKLVRGRTLMSAETCARIGVDAMLAGRRVEIAGLSNKFLAASPRFLPRSVVPGFVKRAQAAH